MSARPTTAGTTAGRREPGGAPGRLHNCGPSTREVFRTPPIGARKVFDLRLALTALEDAVGESAEAAAWPDGNVALPPALVARMARQALLLLGQAADAPGPATSPDEAIVLLGRLRDALRERGTLRGIAGVARELAAKPERKPAARLSAVSAATTLVAYASFAPPLVIWSRAPSLRWFRTDVTIVLHKFDTNPLPAEEA